MEIINLEEHRHKRKERPQVYACGECDSETWCMWTDGIISCANCGALAEGLFVESSPVGA